MNTRDPRPWRIGKTEKVSTARYSRHTTKNRLKIETKRREVKG